MRFIQILVFGLLGSVLPVQFAIADADGEREVLARISHEIEAIEPLIKQAASQANPDTRIRFQYDWLRQDLDQIKRGIQEHIDAPRAEPRTFPPLRGEYRR
ncbi:MAG: RAQPRD family integrative conjugative element protein [Gammaproteobacteria bacterium]|nr:RAQPRD family integrative conjugative element protein [Gammaproteobacteria bacterium]MCP5407900.1 RAQPRD family integrative conjugative element protein [Chromatiaceae bacterium]